MSDSEEVAVYTYKVSDNHIVRYCIRFQMPNSLDYHRILGSK
jgi:hypothetical protein